MSTTFERGARFGAQVVVTSLLMALTGCPIAADVVNPFGAACAGAADCPARFECNAQRVCVPALECAPACTGGTRCVDGACVIPSCGKDSPCDVETVCCGGECRAEHDCQGCAVGAESCPAHQTCVANAGTAICVDDTDAPIADGTACSDGLLAGGNECAHGSACSFTDSVCRQQCADGADCGAGIACVSNECFETCDPLASSCANGVNTTACVSSFLSVSDGGLCERPAPQSPCFEGTSSCAAGEQCFGGACGKTCDARVLSPCSAVEHATCESVDNNGGNVGACVIGCVWPDETCPPFQHCALSSSLSCDATCVPDGTQGDGGGCTVSSDCKGGLDCSDGGHCRAPCLVDGAACTGATCTPKLACDPKGVCGD